MRKHLFGRIVLGFLALTPLLVFALVLGIMFWVRSATLPLGTIVIVCCIGSVILYAATTGYFLYLVQTDERLDSSDKGRWTNVLLLWFPFGAISFWYQFIWLDRTIERS